MAPETPNWFESQWRGCALRLKSACLGTQTKPWRHHAKSRDHWTFLAGVEGRIRVTQASWKTELGPGDRVILPSGRAFDYEIGSTRAKFFTADFFLLPTPSAPSDPLLLIGLPALVPGGNIPALRQVVGLADEHRLLRARARFEEVLLDYLVDGFAAGILPPLPTTPVADWLVAVRGHLGTNFGVPISLDQLAKHAGLSRAHLSHEFRRAFGVTPIEFLYAERVRNAAHFLAVDREASIASIARRCGFADQGHFARRFRKAHGMPPTQWRQTTSVVSSSPSNR